MQKIGRLGLGGVAVLLAACGGKGVGSVGNVHGGAGNTDGKGAEPGLVAPAVNVYQLAANDKAVYWIERGTNNEFAEYNINGALKARDLASGEVTTLASGLYRPDYLGVSARWAYVYVNGDGDSMLRRFPLDAIDATAVEDVAPYSGSNFSQEQAAFAASRDFSYFKIGHQLHRIAETPGAREELVMSDDEMGGITADDTRVYFGTLYEGSPGLFSLDAAGAVPTRLGGLPVDGMAYLSIVDGYLYVRDGFFFSRIPAAGGAWKRFADSASKAAPNGGQGLSVLGGDFYTLEERNKEDRAVITRGALSAPADRTDLASFEHHSGQLTWVATRNGVYWATETAVYFAPTP